MLALGSLTRPQTLGLTTWGFCLQSSDLTALSYLGLTGNISGVVPWKELAKALQDSQICCYPSTIFKGDPPDSQMGRWSDTLLAFGRNRLRSGHVVWCSNLSFINLSGNSGLNGTCPTRCSAPYQTPRVDLRDFPMSRAPRRPNVSQHLVFAASRSRVPMSFTGPVCGRTRPAPKAAPFCDVCEEGQFAPAAVLK